MQIKYEEGQEDGKGSDGNDDNTNNKKIKFTLSVEEENLTNFIFSCCCCCIIIDGRLGHRHLRCCCNRCDEFLPDTLTQITIPLIISDVVVPTCDLTIAIRIIIAECRLGSITRVAAFIFPTDSVVEWTIDGCTGGYVNGNDSVVAHKYLAWIVWILPFLQMVKSYNFIVLN